MPDRPEYAASTGRFPEAAYGPCLLACGRTDLKGRSRLEPLAPGIGADRVLPNNHWHLAVVRAGRLDVHLEDRPRLTLTPGAIVLLPPGARGRLAPSRRMAWVRAAFHLAWQPRRQVSWGQVLPLDHAVQPGPEALFGCTLPVRIDGAAAIEAQRMLALIHATYWRGPAERLLAEAHLGLWIAQLVAASRRDPVAAERHGGAPLDRALARLRTADPTTLEVRGLAQAGGLSPGRLRARCREAYGRPPKVLIQEHRLELAMEHLRSPGVPVADIALRAGYTNVSAFIRAFRRATGATPGSWRRQAAVGPPRP